MTTYPTQAPTAAPKNALKVWTDGLDLYVELPGPYITKLRLSDSGLNKALDLIKSQRYDFGGVAMQVAKYKNTQESQAESILRRRGII